MATGWNEEAATHLKRLVGDIDENKITAILALDPSLEQIEEAMLWFNGYGEAQGNSEWPLKGKVAEIYDILTADLEDESRMH